MSLRFFREFLRSPGSVGAVWPSSPALARMIVRAANVAAADFVLEIGPGSGAFTGPILQSLRPGARFVAIEKSPDLARSVAGRFPSVHVVSGCATELAAHLDGHGTPDSVVSGLPWAAFGEPLQDAILRQVTSALHPDGTFATFAYFGPHWLKAGRAFRKKLEAHFREIRRTPVVVANLPPAFVYFCRK
ncbi:MAG: rRNA adenine N-6-methyltransferase family protein [Verrucomicrobiae bacterium]